MYWHSNPTYRVLSKEKTYKKVICLETFTVMLFMFEKNVTENPNV